jgi:hypothetical protein
MLKAALPELVRVTVCAELVVSTAWLEKVRLVGETLATGAVPVPVKLTVWGLPLALSAMLSAAERDPLAAGVKVTLIVHLPPAATELPHVFVCAKSPALAPFTDMLVRDRLAFPVLVRVIA